MKSVIQSHFDEDRLRRLIAVAVVIVGTTLVLFWVGSFGVNVPIADDWDHVATSIAWHDHGLDTNSLFSPHNEHCLAIPRIITHATLKMSGGNYLVLLFLNAAIAIVTLTIVLAFMTRWPLSPGIFAALATGIGLLLMSWSQWQNLAWAFQTPWFLLPLVLCAAAVVIASVGPLRLVVAVTAGAALLGPLCMANGVVVGWALLPALALRLNDEPRARRWRVFCIAAVAVILATALGFLIASRAHGPRLGGMLAVCAAPLEAARLLLAVIGSPFDPHGAFYGRKTVSTVIGGVSLIVGAMAAVAGLQATKRRSGRDLGPGFALMVYGLASMGAVVIGRLTLLTSDPVESRYQAFSIAWHVGVLSTCGWLAVEQRGWTGRAWRMQILMALSACIIATLTGMNLFLRHGENMRNAHQEQQAIYRCAREPGGREKLRAIAGHYGVDGILERLDGMRRAEILHAAYAPTAADEPEID